MMKNKLSKREQLLSKLKTPVQTGASKSVK